MRPFAEAAVDLQGPVVEEAVLLQGPVRGVRARLTELLAEWPDHPLLTQLAAIADRLLGELLVVVAAHVGLLLCNGHFFGNSCARRPTLAPDTRARAGVLPVCYS